MATKPKKAPAAPVSPVDAAGGQQADLLGDRAPVTGLVVDGQTLTPNQARVLDAMLIGGCTVSAVFILRVLEALIRLEGEGERLSETDIRRALSELKALGLIQQVVGKGYEAKLAQHAGRLDALFAKKRKSPLCWVWTWAQGSPSSHMLQPDEAPLWLNLRTQEERQPFLRLLMFAGFDFETFAGHLERYFRYDDPATHLPAALVEPWLPRAFSQLSPELQSWLTAVALDALPRQSAGRQQLAQNLRAAFEAAPQNTTLSTRGLLAQDAILALDWTASDRYLKDLSGPKVDLLQAARRAFEGQWREACEQFDVAIKAFRKVLMVKTGGIPEDLAFIYAGSLLAINDPKAWATGKKFCNAQARTDKIGADRGWALLAHAFEVRLGEVPVHTHAITQILPRQQTAPGLDKACKQVVVAAWLSVPAPRIWDGAPIQSVLDQLMQSGRPWFAAWVEDAAQRLGLSTQPLKLPHPRPATILGAPREVWRDALAAIVALDEGAKPKAVTPAQPLQLAWQIDLDAHGRVTDLQAYESSVGARGQVKLKALSWAVLKKRTVESPRDNAVLRFLERPAYSRTSAYLMDNVRAVAALVGHPAVMIGNTPGQWVELVEAQPELQVLRRTGAKGQEQFEFSIDPPLVLKDLPEVLYTHGMDLAAEFDKRNSLRVIKEGPQRARVIRLTPTQRRVAELVAQGWAVPASATAELGAALQVLSGHFQLHSDAAAGELVAGDSRLRAQLSPQGDGLLLQLVAQPFGNFGPAVTPGAGRARLMCLHEGVSLATERNLSAEHAHRVAVLEALPFLDPEQAPDLPWHLADPEEALRAVEVLPTLPAIAAIDWPKGKPLRVQPVNSDAMSVQVSSGRDWLGLQGELKVDESRVVSLQQLLTLARDSRSRFVSLGEGQYLALSEQLRQQLRDLDALGQQKKDALQLPPAVANWLDDTLTGMQVAGDKPWQARVEALNQAAALQPQPPQGLRAELRSYQAEGFAWMMRLAQAGLGACLADDMGLGKTLQTLAVLVSRADQGPALVLAPTSVCGNWLAETEKFAPGLRCRVYGDEGKRAEQIDAAGPGDVLVVSYSLAQIDAELFAAKPWSTLVMDEAQALKNAATKRAQSVGEFQADFKLALSGTPVENRLSDLWSIMNLINPGLLGSSTQFNERFAGPIERKQDLAVRARLRRLVSSFLLRRTKAQVLQDLPPRTEIIHMVQPSPEEQSLLEALRRTAQSNVAAAAQQQSGANIQMLAELTRLRRAACDPRLVAPELGLVGAKMGEFEHIVRELVAGQHKALVFSQFTDFLKLLSERLDTMGVPYQYLDGSTPSAERTKRVNAFQKGEGEVFLISLKAGGFGLNLTMADYVLIVDPWWNPAAEDQAMGRAHRMGQQRPVTVYRLVTAGSIEESIIALHRDKRGLADGILEGQEEVTVLDAQTLAALLQG